uniref:Protein translocase subunit SecA n=1 Tax=Sporolithon durum TaxID=48970 RepID=A0A141SCY5_9FLOR|nr:preprotein translocase subunit SecA [Sporolithon durum]AMK96153.1 preprotein translocase subunit SecA [Sporolithon durum]
MFKFLINKRYKKIEEYQIIVKQIKNIQKDIEKLSNNDLKEQTKKLRNKLLYKQNLNLLLPEAFATALEATKRILKLTLFDVQVIGGIVLHKGKIAEMKTGEGKTIVSILPAYLNALAKKGVHIVTVNDYLAKRDSEWVGKVHKFLGLTVGLIQENMIYSIRKLNYSNDITYVTNSELGFDYLKDNMAIDHHEIVQRPFFYAIVDEVDSILIDEARTPLIISGPSETSTHKYKIANEIAKQLKKHTDYEVDEKERRITLTDTGIINCESKLKTNNLYDLNNPWAQFILNALKSKNLFLKDQHYIVRDNLIIIVDEFTGRIMNGRRWSDGLHQAIEAKENVTIQKENQILASITYQNLFLLYKKLSGMTGTAKTEEAEFDKIYNLEVIDIPTNKMCIRKDMPDLVYKNEYAKWEAISRECFDMNQLGRPTLVGTTNIEKSELLANMLTAYKLNYNLLNAKPENIIREAEIIAQAGKKYALTIATNMAGRGTDIILGGNASAITKLLLNKKIKSMLYNINETDNLSYRNNISIIINNYNDHIKKMQIFKEVSIEELDNYIDKIIYTNKQLNNDENIIKKLFINIFKEYDNEFQKEREEVIQLGGLHVIGTERHESRRIDNQLRGRGGRQGDPGSSRFFLSLEDNLLRIFGGEKIANLMQNLQIDENTPIESTILSKSLDNAQKKVEAYFYDTRKQLFDYDEVINNQRQAIYSERKRILEAYFMRDCIIEYAENTIDELLIFYSMQKSKKHQYKIMCQIHKLLNLGQSFDTKEYSLLNLEELKNFLYEQLHVTYDLREAYLEQLKPGLIRKLEKYYLLQQIDKGWQEHLEKMTILRESIGWRSYGQQDPLIEYKNEAFSLFISMTTYIRQTVVYLSMRARLIINTK